MKILITGGAGFIGSHLAEALVARGHTVVIFDNFSLGTKENLAAIQDKITIINGDIRNAAAVQSAAAGVDIIFHEAAASSSPMFLTSLEAAVAANVTGFVNVLQAGRQGGAHRVIFASTSSIYGNVAPPLRESILCEPPNLYSATKLADEHLARLFTQEFGMETIGLRYLSIYGPRENSKGKFANLISQFLWAARAGEPIVMYGDGSQRRDFTYVKDVVQANLLAMDAKGTYAGDIFNVGTGRDISLNEVVDCIGKSLNITPKTHYIPTPVKNYIESQKTDISKITDRWGYHPTYRVEEGIQEMVNA